MKLNPKYTAALLTSVAGIAVIFYYMKVVFKEDKWAVIGGASVMVVEMLVLLATGLVLVNIKKTKQIGQGVLTGAGITLVIGFAICSSF